MPQHKHAVLHVFVATITFSALTRATENLASNAAKKLAGDVDVDAVDSLDRELGPAGIPLASNAIGAATEVGIISGQKGELNASSADSRYRTFAREEGLIVAPGNSATGTGDGGDAPSSYDGGSPPPRPCPPPTVGVRAETAEDVTRTTAPQATQARSPSGTSAPQSLHVPGRWLAQLLEAAAVGTFS